MCLFLISLLFVCLSFLMSILHCRNHYSFVRVLESCNTSLTAFFFRIFHRNGIMQYVIFCAWLFSFSIRFKVYPWIETTFVSMETSLIKCLIAYTVVKKETGPKWSQMCNKPMSPHQDLIPNITVVSASLRNVFLTSLELSDQPSKVICLLDPHLLSKEDDLAWNNSLFARITSWPCLILPIKVFHFIHLLRVPFYLLDEMLPNSWLNE